MKKVESTPSQEQRIVKLTIECIDLPTHDWDGHAEIWLGIQQGKDVVQAVKLPIETVVFDAELRVGNDSSQGAPNFLGPFAQGSAQDRFVYLCWGSRHLGLWAGFRRAKLPLSKVTWTDIEQNHVHVSVLCTDAKGGPICATIRDEFITWSAPKEPA